MTEAAAFFAAGAAPPPGFLQLPFPPGEAWTFDGVHDWNEGEGSGPMSAIDFFKLRAGEPAGGCDENLLGWDEAEAREAWVVAMADGILRPMRRPDGDVVPCWAEVEHAGGWKTWLYHVQSIQAGETGSFVRRGQRVARLAGSREMAECAGGDARDHPHVHVSLLANGSFVKLHGLHLSTHQSYHGYVSQRRAFSTWQVHAGECSYDCRCEHMHMRLAGGGAPCVRCPFCPIGHVDAPIGHVDAPIGHVDATCPPPCAVSAACGCRCGSRTIAPRKSTVRGREGAQAGDRVVNAVGSDEYADPETEPAPRSAPARGRASDGTLRAMLPWSEWWDSGGATTGAARRGARGAGRAPAMQHGVLPTVVEVRNATGSTLH